MPDGKVAIVTDSTASLSRELAEQHNILVVPVSVIIGDVAYDEGTIAPARIAQALLEGIAVTTSRPSPEAFAEAFRVATSYGARRIVSVHLPQGLSGTYESALWASKHAQVPVTVIDANTTGMALGYAAIAGARFAAAGVALDGVVDAVRETAARSFLGVYVESLDYLRRGGRVTAARAIVGTALRFHPLLQMSSTGEVQVVERVRTRARALAHLVDRAVSSASDGSGRVDVAVHHVVASEVMTDVLRNDLNRVEGLLRAALGERINNFCVVPLSAALAAHVGPDAISIALTPVLSE